MHDRPALVPVPTFAAFYRAINGRDPFPWQARLAAQIADTEEWPVEIGRTDRLGQNSLSGYRRLVACVAGRPCTRTPHRADPYLVGRQSAVVG